ncbi:MAG: hypothetical protein ACRDI1_02050 [Actinomycetota bacterium]|jgi:hypothetical protein
MDPGEQGRRQEADFDQERVEENPALRQLAADHTGDCPYGCPVCMTIAFVKQLSPEVTDHLTAAAREFMKAARAFLDSLPADRDRTGETGIEKIPLD